LGCSQMRCGSPEPAADGVAVCFSSHPPATEIYTLSLHDALPIYGEDQPGRLARADLPPFGGPGARQGSRPLLGPAAEQELLDAGHQLLGPVDDHFQVPQVLVEGFGQIEVGLGQLVDGAGVLAGVRASAGGTAAPSLRVPARFGG